MKITSLEVGFPPELASGRLPYEFSSELVKRGYEVTVVTVFPRRYLMSEKIRSRKSGFFYWDTMNGVRVIRVQPEFSHTPLWARAVEYIVVPVSLFFGGLLAGKSDLVLCSSPPLFAAFSGCLLGKVRRVPVMLRLQDIHPDALVKLGIIKNSLLIRFLELLEKFTYKCVTKMTVISEGCLKLVISKGIGRQKIELIPNWTDVDSMRTSTKLDNFRREQGLSDKFVVTYAGIMSWPQDLETLVESANLLQDSNHIQFLLVGQGEQKKLLEEKVRKLKLKNVRFLPLQPRETYFEILQASDVCLVSLKKSYTSPTVPSKMLDIMICSKPIIANVPEGSDVHAIIDQANCGIWVEAGNAEQFKQAILKLYGDIQLREEMGKRGREHVETHFSFTACVDRYEAIMSRALHGR